MEKLDLECLKYLSEDTLSNIKSNYKKIVGVECNPKLLNNDKKNIGRVLLFSNSNNKVALDLIVQFRNDKIKWISSKTNNDLNLVLVNPYWVSSYIPNPKLKIPIKILDIKENQKVTEMVEFTFSQFMKRRLIDYFGDWKHKYVLAYENFCYLIKSKPYYYAINSTVKHYFVTQDELSKVIALVNNKKKKIKAEWNIYLNLYYNQNQSAKLLSELFPQKLKEKESNVINFKR